MTTAISERRTHPGARVASLSGLRWSLFDDIDRAGAENMAVDQALAEGLGRGEAVLRFYGWTSPTVSFGRNEPARGRYRLDPSIAYVRRPTGGRAVLHRDELTYSAVFPAVAGLRSAYLQLHEALAAGLVRLGLPVVLAAACEVASPASPGGCFARPVGGELTVGGRKLLGSAQARIGRAILQHGSLLRVDNQAELSALRTVAERPASSATTLAEVLGRVPGQSELRTAMREAFQETLCVRLPPLASSHWQASARRLRDRYASDEWTWRS